MTTYTAADVEDLAATVKALIRRVEVLEARAFAMDTDEDATADNARRLTALERNMTPLLRGDTAPRNAEATPPAPSRPTVLDRGDEDHAQVIQFRPRSATA